MPHHFAPHPTPIGALPAGSPFGRLDAKFLHASPFPLHGNRYNPRHIYLILQVPSGPYAGIYEAAVNIQSDEGTEVAYAHRIENLAAGQLPELGFQSRVKLAYGAGPAGADSLFEGLTDADFVRIENNSLYRAVDLLSDRCVSVAVYGVVYDSRDGIHDVHMNSGTDPRDKHASDDRDREDGAIAFYFDAQVGDQRRTYAQWLFVKFDSQHVVNFSEGGDPSGGA